MLRNLYAPRFGAVEYAQTILETHSVGSDVIPITATDDDQKVSMLSHS